MSNIITIMADKLWNAAKEKERSQNDCAPDVTKKKCCDNCKHYHWYYDRCEKFECEVDGRWICESFEENNR